MLKCGCISFFSPKRAIWKWYSLYSFMINIQDKKKIFNQFSTMSPCFLFRYPSDCHLCFHLETKAQLGVNSVDRIYFYPESLKSFFGIEQICLFYLFFTDGLTSATMNVYRLTDWARMTLCNYDDDDDDDYYYYYIIFLNSSVVCGTKSISTKPNS